MNCCCCIPCSNAQQNRTYRSTGPSALGETFEFVVLIGAVTILTPLPNAIGAFFSRWGIDVPGILNCVLATFAVSTAFVVVLALAAAVMAGLAALAFRFEEWRGHKPDYSTATSIE